MPMISRRNAPLSSGFSSLRVAIASGSIILGSSMGYWDGFSGSLPRGIALRCPLERGVLFDLGDGREAQQDLLEPVVAERPVAHLGRRARDLLDASLLGDERANLLGYQHELVDRDAALVPGPAAFRASLAAVEFDVGEPVLLEILAERLPCRGIGLLAVFADARGQALGEHADDRRGNHVRLDPDLDQPGDRLGRRVGVQGREHDVPGEGGLRRDLRGLKVPDLADQDHVGILPHERPQEVGELEVDRGVDLALGDTLELYLDRVLDRGDVQLRLVYLVEMFSSGLFISWRAEYRVVVFPEPVGPVTNMIPFGFWMSRLNGSRIDWDIIIFSSVIIDFLPDIARMRTTAFSPYADGIVETRKFAVWFPIGSENLPSCGMRDSAMSRLHTILIREMSARWSFLEDTTTSRRLPSTRKRILELISWASMWMSVARSLIA